MLSNFGARLRLLKPGGPEYKDAGVNMSGRLTLLRNAGHGLLFAAGLGLIVSSFAHAQTGAAATVTSLAGQVSVLRGNSPWALNIGDSVLPKQIIITGPDGMAELRVADGSHFQVFPNSRVVFRDNPGNWKDLLDISIGSVKVFIQKLGSQPNPNSVHTPTAVIAVRGTVFEVVVDPQDDTTVVSVDEGLVEVRHLTVMGPSKLLNAGESITVYKNVPLAKAVDKGSILHGMLRATAQALQEVLYRTSRPGGGTSSGGTGGGTAPPPVQGDTDKDAPPPSLPPPPPPPPM